MFKKTLLIFILLSANVFAQSKDEIIKNKDLDIKNLKDKHQKENIENANKNKENIQKLNEEILSLKNIIKESNIYFLKEMFDDTYNEKYFNTRDLAKEDDSDNFKLSNALINSIKIDAADAVVKICNKVIDFNSNYLMLLEIRDNVLNKKYDESKVNDALDKIKKLPEIDHNSNLGISKKLIYDLLYNYRENICSLKKQLDNYKTKTDQKAIKPLYEKLEIDLRFKNYAYLKQVITDMKRDSNSYTGDDDLLPCIVVQEIKEDLPLEKNGVKQESEIKK